MNPTKQYSRTCVAAALSLMVVTSAVWISCPVSFSLADEGRLPRRLLFFNRSVGYQHEVIKQTNGEPCFAEKILRPICDKHHWELVSTKDGKIFNPANLASFDAFLFYTQGDLTDPKANDGSSPMSTAGKAAFLDAIKNGKGYVGFHCAADTFHSSGDRYEAQVSDHRDPYISMLGGEFITHGGDQSTTMTVVDHKFPAADSLGPSFKMTDEWYSLKNFADDLHVLLVNETNGMQDKCYDRPPYPATWIHNYGQGRVFYTSMGHRQEVWASPQFQNLIAGAISWAVGDSNADTTPNINRVAPQANFIPPK